jgi:hypothetical protein
MHFGRQQLGDWVPIHVATGTSWPVDSSGDRTIPTLTIFDSNSDVVCRDEEIPPAPSQVGLFCVERQLGPEFAAGQYTVLIKWNDGAAASTRAIHGCLTVIPGGNSAGAYVGIHFYRGKNVDSIVGMTDSGLVESRKGPMA